MTVVWLDCGITERPIIGDHGHRDKRRRAKAQTGVGEQSMVGNDAPATAAAVGRPAR